MRILPDPLVIFIFDRTSAGYAAAAVEHLRNQLFIRFDAVFCFASDCPQETIAAARRAIKRDPRLRLSVAPHTDVDLTRRDCVLLAAGGVLLREHAVYMFAAAANKHAVSSMLTKTTSTATAFVADLNSSPTSLRSCCGAADTSAPAPYCGELSSI